MDQVNLIKGTPLPIYCK